MTGSTGQRVRRGTRTKWAMENQGRHYCGCGCGKVIEVKPEHYDRVPTYRLGHNPQPIKPKPPKLPCECGCGRLAGPGKRFVSGHNGTGVPRSAETKAKIAAKMSGELSHRFGKRPANYIGRCVSDQGYVMIHAPGHPFAHKSAPRMMEHRLVMEAHLRATDPGSPFLTEVDGVLYLRPEIHVHHLDHVRDNNVIPNLEPITASEHSRLHANERWHPSG